jgi:hypothetical protein
METNNSNNAASSILNYLLQLIGVALFYWLLLYTTINFWFLNFVHTITKVRYEAGPHFTRELYILLLIYSLFCYLANRFLLDIYHRKTARQLIISIVADYLIWPLQVWIMLLYNNWHITRLTYDISTLFNIYLITGLLIVKNVIAAKILSGKTASVEKAGL